jgi:hypothetical protein
LERSKIEKFVAFIGVFLIMRQQPEVYFFNSPDYPFYKMTKLDPVVPMCYRYHHGKLYLLEQDQPAQDQNTGQTSQTG